MNPLFSQLERHQSVACVGRGTQMDLGSPVGCLVFIPEHSPTSLSPIKTIPPRPGGCFVQLLLGIPDKKYSLKSSWPGSNPPPHPRPLPTPSLFPERCWRADVAVPTPNLITFGISGVLFPPLSSNKPDLSQIPTPKLSRAGSTFPTHNPKLAVTQFPRTEGQPWDGIGLEELEGKFILMALINAPWLTSQRGRAAP